MDKVTPEELQQRLLDKTKTTAAVGIDGLLGEVAIEMNASLQTVAVELWDCLQWGRLRLSGAGVVKVRPPAGRSNRKTPAASDLATRRNTRDQVETHASGVRRVEARVDRDRILQSWAFRRLEGVTQIVTPDHSGHLMHSRLTHSLKVGQVGRRIQDDSS